MLIAFVNFTGLRPSGSWPETAASMVRGLKELGHEVVVIEPSVSRSTLYLHARKAMYKVVGQEFHAERHQSIAKELALSVEKQLVSFQRTPDLILSSSSLPMAYLRTSIPTAFWTDATFSGMLGFYDEFSNLSSETIASGKEVEDLALARCDHAIYSSKWAADSAIEQHRADPAKVHVVPFGPNFASAPALETVIDNIGKRDRQICKMVFIGYDWDRKQGELVVRVQQQLERLGVPAELYIIGSEPKLDRTHRRIHVLGTLKKNTPADHERLNQILGSAHFLVVPSIAECYGMVYAEASAHGVPSVACDVGGVSSVVTPGRNGLLFPTDVSADIMAQRIADIWSNEAVYRALAHSSRKEFDNKLNWNAGISSLVDMLGITDAADRASVANRA